MKEKDATVTHYIVDGTVHETPRRFSTSYEAKAFARHEQRIIKVEYRDTEVVRIDDQPIERLYEITGFFGDEYFRMVEPRVQFRAVDSVAAAERERYRDFLDSAQ